MLEVLVVYSWDDVVSQMRYERMRRILRYGPFRFEQCFALPNPDEETRSETIVASVSEEIDRLQPDILLVHTGAAYHQNPEEYAKAFIDIHSKYPNLRLGLERRRAEPSMRDLEIFEISEEMRSIENTVFP
jgi:hypothetical protein